MRPTLVLVLALSACGSSTPNNNMGSPDLGSGPPVLNPGGVTQNSDGVTITMDDFLVKSGDEVFKYQDFVNPFGGVDAEVVEWESHMTPGSHHLLLFYEDVTKDSAEQDGNGLMFGPTPYGAQQPNLMISYPQGVAATVPGAKGIRLQAHYLNATMNDLVAHVVVTLHTAAAGTVTQHAGVYFMLNPDVTTPPNSTRTVTKSCAFPFAANLIFATGHMHQHATDFTATTNNAMFYETSDWANAPTRALTPPIAVTAGQMLTWSCTFDNMTDQTLIFGESAITNEMCILNGQYYPVPDGMDPLVGCQ